MFDYNNLIVEDESIDFRLAEKEILNVGKTRKTTEFRKIQDVLTKTQEDLDKLVKNKGKIKKTAYKDTGNKNTDAIFAQKRRGFYGFPRGLHSGAEDEKRHHRCHIVIRHLKKTGKKHGWLVSLPR